MMAGAPQNGLGAELHHHRGNRPGWLCPRREVRHRHLPRESGKDGPPSVERPREHRSRFPRTSRRFGLARAAHGKTATAGNRPLAGRIDELPRNFSADQALLGGPTRCPRYELAAAALLWWPLGGSPATLTFACGRVGPASKPNGAQRNRSARRGPTLFSGSCPRLRRYAVSPTTPHLARA